MRGGWCVVWLVVFCAHPAVAQESPTPPAGKADHRLLTVQFHVAEGPGGPVASPSYLAAALAAANRVFEQYGVQFSALATTRLAPGHLRMETRADRHALGQHVLPAVINCFVVESLRDVDEPDRMRHGVHWRSTTYPGTHYVILSAIPGEYVLAHELGHYLGNPRHSDVPGNLMSYTRAEGVPFLDAVQLVNLRRTLRRMR